MNPPNVGDFFAIPVTNAIIQADTIIFVAVNIFVCLQIDKSANELNRFHLKNDVPPSVKQIQGSLFLAVTAQEFNVGSEIQLKQPLHYSSVNL